MICTWPRCTNRAKFGDLCGTHNRKPEEKKIAHAQSVEAQRAKDREEGRRRRFAAPFVEPITHVLQKILDEIKRSRLIEAELFWGEDGRGNNPPWGEVLRRDRLGCPAKLARIPEPGDDLMVHDDMGFYSTRVLVTWVTLVCDGTVRVWCDEWNDDAETDTESTKGPLDEVKT